MDQVVDLSFRQFREPMDVTIGLIEHSRALREVGHHLLLGPDVGLVQLVARGDEFGGAAEPRFDVVGHQDLVFHPVRVLGVAATQQLRFIVGEVVLAVSRRQLVESGHQDAGCVELKEAERTVHHLHPFPARPGFHRVEKCVDHRVVVDEVHEAEPGEIDPHLLVVLVVDDAGDTAHDGPFLIPGQPVLAFAEFESMVLLRVQDIAVPAFERRYIVGIVLVKCVRIMHELPEVFLCNYFLNSNFHGFRYLLFHFFSVSSRRAWPVQVPVLARSSGVPSKTTSPPSSPASGPRSITQSAARITSRLCSTTTME